MPTFVIAGERRCGTTSLYRVLQSHPEVFLIDRTDANFFVEPELVGRRQWLDGRVDRSWTPHAHDYDALFAGGEHAPALGHKGADLFYWWPAHRRMREIAPDLRLVVMLREPAARSWSHYWNEVAKGRETLPFEDALAAEEERSARSDYAAHHLSYRARNHYARSLERLYESFDPSQVHVAILEELVADRERRFAEIFEFLGVAPHAIGVAIDTHVNASAALAPRTWPPAVRPFANAWTRGVEALATRATTDAERRRQLRHRLLRVTQRRTTPDPSTLSILRAEVIGDRIRLEEILGRPVAAWP